MIILIFVVLGILAVFLLRHKLPRLTLWVVIVTVAVILFMLCVFVMLMITMRLPGDKGFGLGWGLGTILWSYLFFFQILPQCTFYTNVNEGDLISDPGVSESAEPTTTPGHRDLRALTEFQAGQHLRWPNETTVKTIDMARHLPVESKGDEEYTLKGGTAFVKLKYLLVTAPLVGYGTNFIQTKPEDAERQIRARAERFLQGQIGTQDSIDFGTTGIEAIEAAWFQKFGQDHVLDDFEISIGRAIIRATLYDIDEPEDIKKARRFAVAFNLIMDTARAQVEASKDPATGVPSLSPSDAVNTAYRILAAMGGNDIDLVDVNGLQAGGILPNLPVRPRIV